MFFYNIDRKQYVTNVLLGRGKQRVKIFGLIHVGNKEFFLETYTELKHLENNGWTITHEVLRDFFQVSLSHPIDTEAITLLHEEFEIFCRYHDLCQQSVALPADKTWVSVDINDSEFKNHLSNTILSNEEIGALKSRTRANIENPSDFIRETTERCLVLFEDIRPYAYGLKQAPSYLEFLLHTRSDEATKKILNLVASGSEQIATIWGAGHIPRIYQNLTSLGFRMLKKETKHIATFKTSD